MRRTDMARQAHLLLVDDDPALLDALTDTLQLRIHGVGVQTCESAATALELLGATEFDAIVADIKMPGMDGLELLRRIRELQPDTPTILITGHGEHELAIQALRLGAHDYVQKPIDREYFVGALKHAIERRRLSLRVVEHRRQLEKQAHELQAFLEQRTQELRELYRREAIARGELEKTTAELHAAHQQRAQLIAIIAHELATPITTLRGYADLVARPNVTPTVRERARNVIVSETRRMEQLVQDLVDRPDEPGVVLHVQRAKYDLVAIARAQVEAAAARSKHHSITLESPDRLDLDGDAGRVAQLFANLLTNAVQHTPGGQIHITVASTANGAHVVVRDEGPGIPPDKLHTIFEPRVQLHARSTHRTASGAGLGLTIARDIVQAHGGRIWVEESEPGQGARFNFVLPIARGRTRRSSGRSARRVAADQLVAEPASRD